MGNGKSVTLWEDECACIFLENVYFPKFCGVLEIRKLDYVNTKIKKRPPPPPELPRTPKISPKADETEKIPETVIGRRDILYEKDKLHSSWCSMKRKNEDSDPHLIFPDLHFMADRGDSGAQCSLSMLQFDESSQKYFRIFPHLPPLRALDMLHMSAKKGNAIAQCALGLQFRYGQSVPQNNEMAIYYFLLSSEQGNPVAKCNLAEIYLEGTDPSQDNETILKLFWSSAQQGNARALANLGIIYQGFHDYETAIQCFQRASSKGNVIAQYHLAEMYLNMKHVHTDGGDVKVVSRDGEDVEVVSRDGEDIMDEKDVLQYGVGDEKDVTMNEKKALHFFRLALETWYKRKRKKSKRYCDSENITRDYRAVVEKFRNLADHGDVNAQYCLAVIYRDGKGVHKDYTNAFHYFKLCAEQGDADAQYNLGLMYLDGKGVQQNYKLALHFFQLSAIQYKQGERCPEKDLAYESAFFFFQTQANEGDPDAQCILGNLYNDGKGVTQDYETALKYYQYSADQGNAIAQYSLGIMYLNGKGVKQDYAVAMKYLMNSADEGYDVAQYHLGIIYRDGIGVDRDYDKAFMYFSMSANLGNLFAQYNLDFIYREHQNNTTRLEFVISFDQGRTIIKQNISMIYPQKPSPILEVEEYNIYNISPHNPGPINVKDSPLFQYSLKYMQRLADQGDPTAQYNLAVMYLTGKGVNQDFNKALTYFQKSADQGNGYAYYNLGYIYYQGIGVAKEEDTAFKYFQKSSVRGLAVAQYNLAVMYRDRIGVKKNNEEAVHYFQLSADQGHVDALYNLGIMHRDGKGVQRNEKTALVYFQQSDSQLLMFYESKKKVEDDKVALRYIQLLADRNDAEAMNDLGVLYLYGYGVVQNLKLAHKYFLNSADKGNHFAMYYLGIMYSYYKDFRNLKEALRCFDNSAKNKNAEANYVLGTWYQKGKFVTQDLNTAFQYFKDSIASKKDHKGALYRLGMMCLHGEGVQKDLHSAFSYLSEAAIQDHAGALYNLSLLYLDDRVRPNPDQKAAFENMKKAAELGHDNAKIQLGLMHRDGKGTQRDDSAAIECFKPLANKRHPEAMYQMGHMYRYGRGVKRDIQIAMEWFQLSADCENNSAHIALGQMYSELDNNYQMAYDCFKKSAEHGSEEGQFFLGLLYYQGKGTTQSFQDAFNNFLISANYNHMGAQFYLGMMYYYGEYVTQDYYKALTYFQYLEKQNNSNALYALGVMYMYGRGVEQNYDKARKYFESAVDLDQHVISQYALGIMYYEGLGVQQDYSTACKYIRSSAEMGYPNARYNLGILYREGKDLRAAQLELRGCGFPVNDLEEIQDLFCRFTVRKPVDSAVNTSKSELNTNFTPNDLNECLKLATNIRTEWMLDDWAMAIALFLKKPEDFRYLNDNGKISESEFVKHLFFGLRCLPFYRGTVFRWKQEMSKYKKGNRIYWKRFVSTSKNRPVKKLKETGGTLFQIKSKSARLLLTKKEEVVIFLPYTFFQVTSETQIESNIVIELEEIPFPYGERVLLWIDDNPTNNTKFMEHPQSLGITIISLQTTEEVENFLLDPQIDYLLNPKRKKVELRVITDMVRNENGKCEFHAGTQVVKCIRDLGYRIKILIFTSEESKPLAKQAMEELLKVKITGEDVRITSLEEDVDKFSCWKV